MNNYQINKKKFQAYLNLAKKLAKAISLKPEEAIKKIDEVKFTETKVVFDFESDFTLPESDYVSVLNFCADVDIKISEIIGEAEIKKLKSDYEVFRKECLNFSDDLIFPFHNTKFPTPERMYSYFESVRDFKKQFSSNDIYDKYFIYFNLKAIQYVYENK